MIQSDLDNSVVTEEDAKKMWCPKFQIATSGGDDSTFETDNRPMQYTEEKPHKIIGLHPIGCCITSRCMAWRWNMHDEVNRDIDNRGRSRGYCGLVGKP